MFYLEFQILSPWSRNSEPRDDKMSRRTAPFVGLNSCERIRPERPRNAIQRLVWMMPGSHHQLHVGFVGVGDADEGSNPRMALRRWVKGWFGVFCNCRIEM